jgi:hypothetical protein
MGLTLDRISFVSVNAVVPAKLRRLFRMSRLRRAAVSGPGRTRGIIPDPTLSVWIVMFAILNGGILQSSCSWDLAGREKILYAALVAVVIGACQGPSDLPSARTRLRHAPSPVFEKTFSSVQSDPTMWGGGRCRGLREQSRCRDSKSPSISEASFASPSILESHPPHFL